MTRRTGWAGQALAHSAPDGRLIPVTIDLTLWHDVRLNSRDLVERATARIRRYVETLPHGATPTKVAILATLRQDPRILTAAVKMDHPDIGPRARPYLKTLAITRAS